MSAGEVRVGDNNTEHLLTIKDQNKLPVDMSEALTLKVLYVRPDKTSFEITPTLVNTGTDGKIHGFLTSAHLNQTGIYKWQGIFTFPLGSWKTDIHNMTVHPNLS